MTSGRIDVAQRSAARIAGVAYILSFVTVVAVNFGVVSRVVVGSDAAAMARNVL